MKKTAIITAILLGTVACHTVSAAPSSKVVWDSATRNLVKSGDIEKGKTLAVTCAGCHGAEGVAPSPAFPSVAGQIARYTFKQLKDYKDGSRLGLMVALVAPLSDQDMADLSAFYASKPLPPAEAGSKKSESAARLVKRGDGARFMAPCESCHGRQGEGKIVDIPALAGQKATYLIFTMQAYKNGRRNNDTYSRMRLISESLTEDEIKELADYYAAMGGKH